MQLLTRTIWVSCLSHFLLLLLHSRQICNGSYTATRVMLNKICTMMAKSAPYPPCTVTVFWLKYQDSTRMLRRVTQPPHIAGPLAVIFLIPWTFALLIIS